jgi:hypothetical protein
MTAFDVLEVDDSAPYRTTSKRISGAAAWSGGAKSETGSNVHDVFSFLRSLTTMYLDSAIQPQRNQRI